MDVPSSIDNGNSSGMDFFGSSSSQASGYMDVAPQTQPNETFGGFVDGDDDEEDV